MKAYAHNNTKVDLLAMDSSDDDDGVNRETPMPFSPVKLTDSGDIDDDGADNDDGKTTVPIVRASSPKTASSTASSTTSSTATTVVAESTSCAADEETMRAVLEICTASVLTTNETCVAIWDVTFVNQWAKEQERVLILTSKNLYRVKFDFAARAAIHFDRTDLLKIDMIHKGFLRVEGWSSGAEPQYKLGSAGQKLLALRVLAGEKNTKLTDSHQYMRTYCALNPTDDGKSIVNEIVTAVAAQIQLRRGRDATSLVAEVDIVIKNGAPVISTLHNMFGLGFWKTKK